MVPCLSDRPRLLPRLPHLRYTTSSTHGLSSHSQPQSFHWVWPLNQAQYPAPTTPLDKHLRHRPSVQVSLHFALCCCALLRALLFSKAPSLSPSVRGLPSVQKPFVLHSSLPEAQGPSWFLSFFPFLFLLTYSVTQRLSCPFGRLRSCAGIQWMFGESRFICRRIFDISVGRRWAPYPTTPPSWSPPPRPLFWLM